MPVSDVQIKRLLNPHKYYLYIESGKKSPLLEYYRRHPWPSYQRPSDCHFKPKAFHQKPQIFILRPQVLIGYPIFFSGDPRPYISF